MTESAPDSFLLQQLVQGQAKLDAKLDKVIDGAAAMNERVTSLEADKKHRDEGRTSREKWVISLLGSTIGLIVGMGLYLIRLGGTDADLIYQLSDLRTNGTSLGRENAKRMTDMDARLHDLERRPR